MPIGCHYQQNAQTNTNLFEQVLSPSNFLETSRNLIEPKDIIFHISSKPTGCHYQLNGQINQDLWNFGSNGCQYPDSHTYVKACLNREAIVFPFSVYTYPFSLHRWKKTSQLRRPSRDICRAPTVQIHFGWEYNNSTRLISSEKKQMCPKLGDKFGDDYNRKDRQFLHASRGPC